MTPAETRFRLLYALGDGRMPSPTHAGRYIVWSHDHPGRHRWLVTEIEAMIWTAETTPALREVVGDALDELVQEIAEARA